MFAMNMFTCNAEQKAEQSDAAQRTSSLGFGGKATARWGGMMGRKAKGETDKIDGSLVGDGDSPHTLLVVFVTSVFQRRGQAAGGARRGGSEVM